MADIFKPDVNQIMQVMRRKGYKTFTSPHRKYDLNIIGIRARNSKMNVFDDTLCIMYMNNSKELVVEHFQCTTLAGKHWMLNPMNSRGTIILLPGQYRGVYALDYHNKSKPAKKYEALRQIKKMKYVRDNNKDLKHDYEGKGVTAPFWGIYYTNLHRASVSGWSKFVDKWSAGCQVVTGWFTKNLTNYDRVMELAYKQRAHGWGGTFTYTLLEEKDFD